jgi:hypothetical protein
MHLFDVESRDPTLYFDKIKKARVQDQWAPEILRENLGKETPGTHEKRVHYNIRVFAKRI